MIQGCLKPLSRLLSSMSLFNYPQGLDVLCKAKSSRLNANFVQILNFWTTKKLKKIKTLVQAKVNS